MKQKKVLFVYTAENATGLSHKAKKIACGFVEAGCVLDSIYLGAGAGKLSRIVDMLTLYFRFIIRSSVGQYDIIYMRYAYYFIPLYILTSFIQADLQVEVNSNANDELLARGQKIRAIFDRVAMAVVQRAAKKIHVVSKSLAECLQYRYPDANFVFTANFVVDEKVYEKQQKKDGVVNLVFMGNAEQKWHGISLFVEKILANNEWFKTACHLHFIGRIDDNTRQRIKTLGLQHAVTFHGLLFGEQKYEVLSRMDIGLSSFDLMFKGMTETTAIKTGEYLHSGIGLIIGYEDPVIPSTLPFVLRIDLMADIKTEREKFKVFIEGFRDIHNVEKQAHLFAKNNLLVDRYIGNILTGS